MTEQNTSPPAFPLADSCCEYGNTNRSDANGMTLRDYFAAKAMQGFATNLGPGATFETRAEIAYQWADTMLKARKTGGLHD